MNLLEFKKSDPKVAYLVRLCYPNYRGRRKVRVESRKVYRIHDYWDGGSRSYASFVHLPTRRRVNLDSLQYEHQSYCNHFNLPIGRVNLSLEIAVVENVIFMGKDLGIRIYMHPGIFDVFAQ